MELFQHAEKIEKAKALGATGGVIYKEKDWEKKLQSQLPKDRPYLDTIIDGAGGDIMLKANKLLKVRGFSSCSIYNFTND